MMSMCGMAGNKTCATKCSAESATMEGLMRCQPCGLLSVSQPERGIEINDSIESSRPPWDFEVAMMDGIFVEVTSGTYESAITSATPSELPSAKSLPLDLEHERSRCSKALTNISRPATTCDDPAANANAASSARSKST